MKKNMGNTDRLLRIVAAAVIIGLYIADIIPATFAIALLAIAIVFILTSFISFCPLYFPFGISTLKRKTK